MTRAEFIQGHVEHRLLAGAGAPLPCRLLMPKRFEARAATAGNPEGRCLLVARYAEQLPASGEVAVSLAKLPCEVNVGDFAEQELAGLGETMLERSDHPRGFGCQSTVQSRRMVHGQPWIRLSRFVKDGAYVFQVSATSLESAFRDFEAEAKLCLGSFSQMEPTGRFSAEPVERRELLGVLSFAYPASWTAAPPGEEASGLAVLRLESGGKLMGLIEVQASVAPHPVTASALARAFSQRLMARGIRLNGAAVLPQDPPPGLQALHLYHPPAMSAGAPVEVQARIRETHGGTVLLGTACRGRDASPWDSARCRRAREIIEGTLRLSTGAAILSPLPGRSA